MIQTLQLRKGKSESLRRFHPWIFSGAITRIPENLAEGALVRVVDENNKFMALGHYQIGSIAIRRQVYPSVSHFSGILKAM